MMESVLAARETDPYEILFRIRRHQVFLPIGVPMIPYDRSSMKKPYDRYSRTEWYSYPYYYHDEAGLNFFYLKLFL